MNNWPLIFSETYNKVDLLPKKMKIVKFANSIDPVEMAQNELPYLDLHSLPSSLLILNMIQLRLNIMFKFCRLNFVVCYFFFLFLFFFFFFLIVRVKFLCVHLDN